MEILTISTIILSAPYFFICRENCNWFPEWRTQQGLERCASFYSWAEEPTWNGHESFYERPPKYHWATKTNYGCKACWTGRSHQIARISIHYPFIWTRTKYQNFCGRIRYFCQGKEPSLFGASSSLVGLPQKVFTWCTTLRCLSCNLGKMRQWGRRKQKHLERQNSPPKKSIGRFRILC